MDFVYFCEKEVSLRMICCFDKIDGEKKNSPSPRTTAAS